MEDKKLILVIDPNEDYAKQLADHAKNSGYFYDSAYALNGETGLDMCNILRPDVIILETLMPVLDGIGFLRRFNNLNIEKKPIIIMSSAAQLNGMLAAAAGYGVDYFMIKPQPFSDICATAHDLLQGTEQNQTLDHIDNTLEKNITDFLRNLGMPAHLDGYKYMRSAILLTLDDPGVISPITKKLYPMIANKYHTSKNCVERALRHAIEVSWQRGNKKLLFDIFGYSSENSISRPTNAEYIAMAVDDFRLKMHYGMI